MLETELINQRVKQSKDEEIQRGRAGEENSSGEAGPGRAHSREGEEGQQELREDAGGSSPSP